MHPATGKTCNYCNNTDLTLRRWHDVVERALVEFPGCRYSKIMVSFDSKEGTENEIHEKQGVLDCYDIL